VRKLALLFASLVFLFFVAAACGSDAEPTCDVGSGVFCRCLDGGAGQKKCNDDGSGFGPCQSSKTGLTCEEGSVSVSNGSSSTSSGSTGGKKLLTACSKNSECKSGMCNMGYCTKDCAKFADCVEFGGDCVQIEGKVQQCAPYCLSWADCEDFGTSSLCSYTTAVDAYGVAVCAEWSQVNLPPDGADCLDDFQCHLGYGGEQRVCEFEKCLTGCHADDDCPDGGTCSGGAPGQCM